IPDLRTDQSYTGKNDRIVPLVEIGGARTFATVPMLKEGELIGAISIYRQEVKPFTDKQIELVKNFGAQAVIAIENARLLSELRESLQQQTATANVVKVISSSVSDLKPVFEIIGQSAERLCDAEISVISMVDGDVIRLASINGVTKEGVEAVRNAFYPMRRDDETVTARAIRSGTICHVADVLGDALYKRKDAARVGGFRGSLGVPMIRDGQVIGAIFVARRQPGLFADSQVQLLKTFADQAVVAIENVRLFNETKEALAQQTATGEVLNVISRSPTNAQPVFDAICESASRLCDAVFSAVWRYDGDLLHYAASHNFTAEILDSIFKRYPRRPDRSVAVGRAILDGRVAHVPDMLADPGYAHELALAGNWRASIAVPMLRDGKPVGAIFVGKAEAGPFSERQMQLLTTFADQAVIAIENVKLFDEVQTRTRELSESLQQQTATADVLKVISRSTFDLPTVLQTLIESAARLCDADKGNITREKDGVFFRAAESYGYSREFVEHVKGMPIERDRGSATGRALLEKKVIHIPD